MMSMDKTFAQKGMGRIPESTLLLLAFFGGSLGVVSAQQIERHKTRKQPFKTYLRMILLLQILSIAGATFYLLR